jgi:hypothetical protein
VTLTLELDDRTKKLAKRLEKLDEAFFYEQLDGFFEREASRVASYIGRTKLRGSPLKRRTGILARSTVGRGVRVNGIPGMRVGVFTGPALKYAAAQEYGADIRPVKAKALAIPTSEVKTPAGVSRFDSPRDYPEKLHFRPFRRGNVIGGLFDSSGKLLWILASQVRIEGKHWLSSGVEERLPEVSRALREFIARLFESQERNRRLGRDARGRFTSGR